MDCRKIGSVVSTVAQIEFSAPHSAGSRGLGVVIGTLSSPFAIAAGADALIKLSKRQAKEELGKFKGEFNMRGNLAPCEIFARKHSDQALIKHRSRRMV